MKLSTLKKFLGRNTLEDEMNLHRADCLSSHGGLDNFDFVREKQKVIKLDEIKPPALVTGKDLISMGFKPGPRFGKILDKIYDLQLEEELKTSEDAINFIKENSSHFF